ncbi:MAG TPA: NBR1-Ig-like domain-containing protein [Burkholderiales bacterium]|nr:NBR1-Ig-like domain-containing protein [Burkholderiales bacterium]
MNFKMNRLVFVLVATALLAAACAPGQATPDAAEIADQIATAVAATVSAQQSATAAALALATATLAPTATSTFTPTPVLPTATPFVIVPATSSGGGGGGGGGGSATFACDPDTGKRPRDNSEFHPGDDFDVKWTIINTGTETWPAGYDLVYFSGPQMTSVTFLELPEVKPGKSYSVVLDGNAPAEKGFQVMTWKLQGGFCYPYVAIQVN